MADFRAEKRTATRAQAAGILSRRAPGGPDQFDVYQAGSALDPP